MCVFIPFSLISIPSIPFFLPGRSFHSFTTTRTTLSVSHQPPRLFTSFRTVPSLLGDRSHPVDRFNLGIATRRYRPAKSRQTRPVDPCESIALPFESCIGQPFIFHLPLPGTLLRRALTTQPPHSDVDAVRTRFELATPYHFRSFGSQLSRLTLLRGTRIWKTIRHFL